MAMSQSQHSQEQDSQTAAPSEPPAPTERNIRVELPNGDEKTINVTVVPIGETVSVHHDHSRDSCPPPDPPAKSSKSY